MPYRALIAHVYSSPDSYAGDSRTLGPFRPTPDLGAVTVKVGRPPRWLFRARQRLYALDIMRGGNLVGWLDGGTDPKFRLQRGQLSRPWYTTVILELTPLPLDVGELDKAMELEAVVGEAAVLLAADSKANVIAARELRGLFLQRSDGNWVKTPAFELFPPTIGFGQSEATLRSDLLAAKGTLGAWRAPAGGKRFDWALKALLTDEPWSQFVWWMFSLEQLVAEHLRSSRPAAGQPWRTAAESYLRAAIPGASPSWRGRPVITLAFAALAAHLSPATGAADTANFHRLKKIRDSMLHGDQSEAPDGATRQAARELTLRYNKLFTMAP